MLGFTSRARAAAALAVLAGAGLAALPMSSAHAAPFSNACYNSATAQIAPVPTEFSASVPATTTPGGEVKVTNLKATFTMPGTIFATGARLGVIKNGDTVAGKVKAVIAAAGSAEGQKETALVDAALGPVTINPDGTAEAVTATVSFPDLTFTAGSSGKVELREASVPITNADGGGGFQADANLGFITVKFRCSPGTVDTTANTAAWNSAPVFATTTVESPAAAPVANDDTLTVGANQAGSVNVVANDTDANGDIAPGSVAIVDAPANGTAVANADGTVTYTNTAAATSDSFTYTVKDAGGRVSNTATVAVTVNSDTGGPGADLDQAVEIDVEGAGISMKQAGGTVALPPVTLNGQQQKVLGELNDVTIVNASGNGAAWSLTGQMTTDYSNGAGSGVCPADDKSTWNRNCIPAGNTGWAPEAQVAHTAIPGDVAAVKAGPALAQGGLDEASELCSAADGTSGGTFTCGGTVGLGIPASAASGTYKATLTLTLV